METEICHLKVFSVYETKEHLPARIDKNSFFLEQCFGIWKLPTNSNAPDFPTVKPVVAHGRKDGKAEEVAKLNKEVKKSAKTDKNKAITDSREEMDEQGYT